MAPNPAPPPQIAARPRQSILVRVIAMVLLALIVLVGLAVLIIWLSVRPKHLVYSIEDGSIHDYNLSNNHLNANFHFVLRAHNPNSKVSIYYDKMEATVYYNDETLAFNTVEPFFQPHRNVTRIGLNLGAKDVSLYDPVAKDLKLERSAGEVELEVRLKAKIRFKVGAWKSKHRTLRISCEPVMVHFSSSKNFGRALCDVDL
ncbi:hypothetical protein RJ639_044603 [Escallonia herrerae]|uniref:Late embryogenesis abundant protein LEA-2 subgroup domain-containing protein n=1 Tax=Escallonia herrerae TaxID=1293975 RepID=A0AA88WCY9_9ASTE|nr:hypothetical protein RJ639_044603 [Escallonia herrerae]